MAPEKPNDESGGEQFPCNVKGGQDGPMARFSMKGMCAQRSLWRAQIGTRGATPVREAAGARGGQEPVGGRGRLAVLQRRRRPPHPDTPLVSSSPSFPHCTEATNACAQHIAFCKFIFCYMTTDLFSWTSNGHGVRKAEWV